MLLLRVATAADVGPMATQPLVGVWSGGRLQTTDLTGAKATEATSAASGGLVATTLPRAGVLHLSGRPMDGSLPGASLLARKQDGTRKHPKQHRDNEEEDVAQAFQRVNAVCSFTLAF